MQHDSLPTYSHACVPIPVLTGGRVGRASGAKSACSQPVHQGCVVDRSSRGPVPSPTGSRDGRRYSLPSPTRAYCMVSTVTAGSSRRRGSEPTSKHARGFAHRCEASAC